LEFYLKLRLPTTKRMYRFLDKRFYRRSRLDFDLRSLACEHIGLSRSYAPTELKRRLKPALEEMEQLGFLEPLTVEERYCYVSRGCWRIIFIRGRRATVDAENPAAREEQQPAQLVEALKVRGVTSKTAQELVDAHSAGRIRTKMEVFDWLLRNEDKRVGKNPAGYLVASIRSDYQVPGDYRCSSSGVKSTGGSAFSKDGLLRSRQAQQRHGEETQAQRDKVHEAKLRAAWDRLPEAERDTILATVKSQNPGLGRWKNMLEPLCLSMLETRLTEHNPACGQRLLFPDAEIAK
jgi:hypothetical protein